jgi:hypothetical protein
MWSFFKRFKRSCRAVSIHGFVISGGEGNTVDKAIVITPENREKIRRDFHEKLRNSQMREFISSESGLDSVIAEMVKRKYLIELFGREGADWEFGELRVVGDELVEQKILFPNGDKKTFYFDLTNICSLAARDSGGESVPSILIGESRPVSSLILRSRYRTFEIDESRFTVLLVVGFDSGWEDGKSFLDESPEGIFLKPLIPGTTISDSSATQLAQVLAQALPSSDTYDEEVEFCRDFMQFAGEGSFVIEIVYEN